MTPQTRQQIITMYMSQEVSRSKEKSGNGICPVHKIWCEKYFFFQKSCGKWDGETSSRPFFVF